VVQRLRRTRDRKVAGSTPGRGAIKSTIGQVSLPSLQNRVPACVAGVRRGAFTCVGWKVTLCDPIWQVTSRSSEVGKSYIGLYPRTWSNLLGWRSSASRFLVDNDWRRLRHHRTRHWIFHLHDCLLSATERSPSPRHEHGTVCQLKWRHQIPCKPSKLN